MNNGNSNDSIDHSNDSDVEVFCTVAGASKESNKNTATAASSENFEPTSSSKSPTTAHNINDAIFTKLCGYGLFKLEQKKDAIASFLLLSSVTSAFTDPEVVNEVKKLCQPLQAGLQQAKSKKKGRAKSSGTTSLPDSWKGLTCADFILQINILLVKDQSKSKTKKRKRSLPSALAALVNMYETAKAKVEEESAASKLGSSRTKSSGGGGGVIGTSKPAVDTLLIRSFPQANSNVKINLIESQIRCPECGHASIAPVESEADIKRKNENVRQDFLKKFAAWEAAGKVGPKPRNKATHSQTLACFCYKQNCAGSASGLGCFLCDHKKGQVGLTLDPR